MSPISDQERQGAIQNLIRESTLGGGRRWYLYLCSAQLLASPVAFAIGLAMDWWWLTTIGAVAIIGPSMLLGWVFGQFNGALHVAATAVDQLINYADEPASSSLLADLKTGRPLRRAQ